MRPQQRSPIPLITSIQSQEELKHFVLLTKTEFAHDCDTKYLTFTFGRKIVWWENDIRKCHISAHARQSKNNLPSAKLSFVIVAERSRRQKPIIIECVIFTWTEEPPLHQQAMWYWNILGLV